MAARCSGAMLGCLLCLLLGAGNALAEPVQDEETLLLLEVQLDGQAVGPEPLMVYQSGQGTFLPLTALAQSLELALNRPPGTDIVQGFILDAQRRFQLNPATGTVQLNGREHSVDPTRIQIHSDDIYVEAGLVTRWLPIDIRVETGTARLIVTAREALPSQQRAEREQRWALLRDPAPTRPDYPHQPHPYQLVSPPFIDQSLLLSRQAPASGPVQHDVSFTTYATADLLYHESSWYLAGGEESIDDVRVTLGRKAPQADLLGPLGARSYSLGHLNHPGQTLIARTQAPRPGLQISRYPLSQQSEFDRHTFQGDLAPGWSVELYRNGVLVDFQGSADQGRYHFNSVPLVFGMNRFKLVFYGPHGQQREEYRSFLLGDSLTPPGQFHYRLAVTPGDDPEGRLTFQSDLGLTRNFSVAAGYARLPGERALEPRQYGRFGLRAFRGRWYAHTDSVISQDGGRADEIGVQTRLAGVGLSLSRIWLDDYVSEVFPASTDPVQTRDRLNLATTLPLGPLGRVPMSAKLTRDRLASGRQRGELGHRLSGRLLGLSFNNSLQADYQDDQVNRATGAFQLSYRAGRYKTSGQINYTLFPVQEAVSLNGRLEGPLLAPGYQFGLGINHVVESGQDQYSAQLSKTQGRLSLGFNASQTSDGATAFSLSASTSLGVEPSQLRPTLSAASLATAGTVSVHVFIDDNNNGTREAGERAVSDIGFRVDGQPVAVASDAEGIAFITGLKPYRTVNLSLATETLEDPAWVPGVSGKSVQTRPGHSARVEFPITLSGELEGIVQSGIGRNSRPLAGVEVELRDIDGERVQSTRTAYDGYYYFSRVPQGPYSIGLADDDLERLRLRLDTQRQFITVGNDLVSGVTLALWPRHNTQSR
ncbi:MAG: hypothetical protein WD251_07145 [Saccharospirillum sp.]|uniref:collagen binding domain-containing protein n=1 Tax=Saccharospirillum sp. TaxID=2033801 RepID=UPI0034A0AB16